MVLNIFFKLVIVNNGFYFNMCYVPTSFILSSCSCLPQWSTILNLSQETTDLTHQVSAVLSLKLTPCSLLTFISVLRVVILKLLVKPPVYNCILAHSTNQSKNHRMPEFMAMKRKSQGKSQNSGLWWQLLWQVFILPDEETLSYLSFFFFKCHLHIDSIESFIYSTCHELLCDRNKINSCHP